jgi:hypothetical protein
MMQMYNNNNHLPGPPVAIIVVLALLAMSLVIRHSAFTISTSNPHQKVQCVVLENCVVGANQPIHHPI